MAPSESSLNQTHKFSKSILLVFVLVDLEMKIVDARSHKINESTFNVEETGNKENHFMSLILFNASFTDMIFFIYFYVVPLN